MQQYKYLINDKYRTLDDLERELKDRHSLSFFDDSFYYNIFWSDANEGWYYDIYQIKDLDKDKEGNIITEDINDEYILDGGLCTGSPRDAIEMMMIE